MQLLLQFLWQIGICWWLRWSLVTGSYMASMTHFKYLVKYQHFVLHILPLKLQLNNTPTYNLLLLHKNEQMVPFVAIWVRMTLSVK